MKINILIFLMMVLSSSIFATTWDEPWHNEVVKTADSFIHARINSVNRRNGLDLTVIKTISGKQVSGRISITDFYLHNITSFSGNRDYFSVFQGATEAYFFIKQNQNGNYSIATPTTGFAIFHDGIVYATYRHSYHQASVSKDIYEKTMEAIFNNYHNQLYDIAYINEFIRNYIFQDPASPNSSDSNLFFMQHIALECIYHLRLPGYYSQILSFLDPNTHFHAQVSAIRALIAYNTDECKNELLKIINAINRDNFVQVMSIWILTEFKPTELRHYLIELERNASTDNNGFGGNIMDPRVGTYIPSVRIAIQNLINSLWC